MRYHRPECLVTGITLYEAEEGLAKPADLFSFQGVYIVNASGEGEHRHLGENEKALLYFGMTPHFERRNVYVFPTQPDFLLNPAARDYINKAPR